MTRLRKLWLHLRLLWSGIFPKHWNHHTVCPYGVPGNRLWVKETWTGAWYEGVNDMHLSFAADGGESCVGAPAFYTLPKAAAKPQGWVSPLFMPRWASRITLEITDVRVQRVQEISEKDARAEGIYLFDGVGWKYAPGELEYDTAREAFCDLWGTVNAKRGHGWDVNDWVWAVSFKRMEVSL